VTEYGRPPGQMRAPPVPHTGRAMMTSIRNEDAGSIGGYAGVGLRLQHLPAFLAARPPIPRLEIHSETFVVDGGPRLRALEAIRSDYSISAHSLDISLCSATGLDTEHLRRLRALYDRIEPFLISDHLAWNANGGTYLNDLLPIPYNEEALEIVARSVDHAQAALNQRILVENPARYLHIVGSDMPEQEFLAEIMRRTGCGLLLDLNNIYVSNANLGLDSTEYLSGIPTMSVGEIHIAGHAACEVRGLPMLVDDHGSPIGAPVWKLLEAALGNIADCPVLVEWDNCLPPLPMLLAEATQAQERLDAAHEARRAA
jgi:uncharacterized protein (UPF0276 family)